MEEDFLIHDQAGKPNHRTAFQYDFPKEEMSKAKNI